MLHLGHGGVPETNTRLWSFMRGCERAANAWYADWVGGREVRVAASGESGIECGLRIRDGRSVLIAVNLCKEARTLRYTDPVRGEERVVWLPGCGSVVLASMKGPKGKG